jgi:hypothetical protein
MQHPGSLCPEQRYSSVPIARLPHAPEQATASASASASAPASVFAVAVAEVLIVKSRAVVGSNEGRMRERIGENGEGLVMGDGRREMGMGVEGEVGHGCEECGSLEESMEAAMSDPICRQFRYDGI